VHTDGRSHLLQGQRPQGNRTLLKKLVLFNNDGFHNLDHRAPTLFDGLDDPLGVALFLIDEFDGVFAALVGPFVGLTDPQSRQVRIIQVDGIFFAIVINLDHFKIGHDSARPFSIHRQAGAGIQLPDALGNFLHILGRDLHFLGNVGEFAVLQRFEMVLDDMSLVRILVATGRQLQQETLLQVTGRNAGRIKPLDHVQDRFHDFLGDFIIGGNFADRTPQQSILVQATDDVLADATFDAFGHGHLQLFGQIFLSRGDVFLRSFEVVVLVVARIVGRPAKPFVPAIAPVTLLVFGIHFRFALFFIHGRDFIFVPDFIFELVFGFYFFQEGIALQFVAQDLLKLQGRNLQKLESLLKPLRHHQVLAQREVLS